MASSALQGHQLVAPPKPAVQTSKLLALPAELLDMIFQDFYTHCDPPAPICRALLPYYDQPRFRRVRVPRLASLATFCRYLSRRPCMGTACTMFEVTCRWNRPDLELPPGVVSLLLASLPHLRSIKLNGDQLVEAFLARATRATPFMPCLVDIALGARMNGYDDPYDSLYLGGLANFSELKSLSLDLLASSKLRCTEANTSVDETPLPVEDLSISLAKSSPGAARLVKRCTRLKSLSISDAFVYSAPAPLLAAASTLTLLERLVLKPLPGTVLSKVPREVAALRTLTKLVLGRGTFCTDEQFVNVLCSLPLERVEFAAGSVFTAETVEDLVCDHPTLELLVLDTVHAWMDDPPHSPDNSEVELRGWLRCGYQLPDWSLEFEREDLDDLAELAAEEDVELVGTAVDAARVEDLIAVEVALVEAALKDAIVQAQKRREKFKALIEADEAMLEWCTIACGLKP
ncbi:hypothetical protein JCM10450v2_002965 [Rhodotorula kratochvilovae]